MKIELRDIKSLGVSGRVVQAGELWRGRRNTTGLERELPYPAAGYKYPWRAYRRLGRIASQADEHNLAAFVIIERGKDLKTLGMATAQLALPKPVITGTMDLRGAIELSYWHEHRNHDTAIELGHQILIKLSRLFTEIPSATENEVPWMVTLPDDRVKAAVCKSVGLGRLGQPRPYEIGDGVTEARQLWTGLAVQ